MLQKRKQRLVMICLITLGVGIGVLLTLYALRQNINLYYTPSKLLSEPINPRQNVRLGGMVKKGSFHQTKQDLSSHFMLTDYDNEVIVSYSGVLPALFREGQGIVVLGHLNNNKTFTATQVLAKHDAKYMPPNIKRNAYSKVIA